MSLAHYLLQVNLYLVIFYFFYKILLSAETYFIWNRIYLLASGLLSSAIPFLRFEWFGKQEVAKPIYVGVDQLAHLVGQVTVLEDDVHNFNWGNLIVLIYLIGVIAATFIFLSKLFAIKKLIANVGHGMAFSFLRKKVVSKHLPSFETVNLHEDVHVKQLHTVDVLFFELIGIFNWFNPIVYAYKKTIRNIHEYLADEAAATFQGDKEAYALLLLSQAFGVAPNTLTNGFFTKSLIKKRIMMLHKRRSRKTAVLKYGLFVPVFALTLMLSSATIRKNKQILAVASKIPLESVNEVLGEAIKTPLAIVGPEPPAKTKEGDRAVTVVPATDVSGKEAAHINALNGFYTYLTERISYPAEAIAKQVQGNTVINFTVRHGKINNVVVQAPLGEGCDEGVVSEITGYNDYFEKDGNYSLKITFKLNGASSAFKNENVTADHSYQALQNIVVQGNSAVKDEVDRIIPFISLDQPPTYPGGIGKFYDFIGKNIKYPAEAIDREIQGNVHIAFIVEKDGSLSDIKVVRKLGFGTDEEALRVIKLTKKWNPGLQNGKPVRVQYNIPIKFALNAGNRLQVLAAYSALKDYTSANAPLFIVDNQIRELSFIGTLEAKDIESINIIKDLDAVGKFGRSAQNGAVIIKLRGTKPTMAVGTLINRN